MINIIQLHMNYYPSLSSFNMTNVYGFILISSPLIQLVTGLLSVIHHSPTFSYNSTFTVVVAIGNDHNMGYIIRNFHIIVASVPLLFIYLHLNRGLYINTFISNIHVMNLHYVYLRYDIYLVYMIGLVIMILFILEGFIGYSSVSSNLSYRATIATLAIVTVIPITGRSLFYLLLSSYLIALSRPSLVHFSIGFIILGFIVIHPFILHGSSITSTAIYPCIGNIPSSSILFKDIVLFTLTLFMITALSIIHTLDIVSDCTINAEFDLINTPLHIVPEWHFPLIHAISRSIPIKSYGMVGIIPLFILML